ncbi:DUF1566 domain-containing protein [Desulfococcus sp.]|uniref:Lcl C-terminal domain-containing protein n=1 Tax=Desulfococcus sp. TaxID=2025834 RepID=UPI0035930074
MGPHLLETDQIRCYAEDGEEIPCSGTGQDAAFEKSSRLLQGQRFEVLDRVVRDGFTGAVWTRDANPAEYPLTWQEALDFAMEMRKQSAHGYSDWQLPSRRLLFSLLSHQNVNPSLACGHPFENVFTGYYWTGDTCRRLPDQAWYGHMGGGRIHRGMKYGSYMVWPVSSPHKPETLPAGLDNDRFTVDGDYVYDARTRLTWHRNADFAGRRLTWQEALSRVQAFNSENNADGQRWRLPNIRELESLVDLGEHTPALPAGHPFLNVREAYWSSTTSVYEPRYAWTLYSRDGFIGVGFKPRNDFYAWPMKSG